MSLNNKIVWITGAGTGIGLGGAQALAAAGATVVMSGRRAEVLDQEATALRAKGFKAEVAVLDVTDAAAVGKLAQDILNRHGQIDILVNSAGLNVAKRFWRNQSVAGWNEVIRINLDGTFYCCHAVLPAMRARRDGLIINISSWAGVYHSAITGPAYNGSKFGVVALTESINVEECINGVRACVICPNEVATPIMDRRPVPPTAEERGRMMQMEDLGEAIRFVAQMPAHVCVNQIIISPTWNRGYVPGAQAINA